MQEKKIKFQKCVAKIIQKTRDKQSISKLCNEIDLSKSIWSSLEKGNKDIQLSTFWRIAEALDCKPSELLQKVEEELGDSFSFWNS